MSIPQFFLFAIGLIIGLLPPFIWGKIGGDEGLIYSYPKLTGFLKLIHHWQIGIAMLICAIIAYLFICQSELWVLIAGWGTSTTMDDIMFHSFESYFERKNG